jgi:hypothetical protein
MNIDFIDEPDLEFGGGGHHIDVRFGLMQHGPLDRGMSTAPAQLRVGIVGTEETIEGVQKWLEKTRSGTPAKDSRLANLFPPFPGFSNDSCFGSSLVFHERWLAPIHKREIQSIITAGDFEHLVDHAVDLFLDHAGDLNEPGGPMVIICAPPLDLLAALESNVVDRPDVIDEEIDEGSEWGEARSHRVQPYFHDLLKACGMQLKIPIQMVRPDTYGGQKHRRNRETFRPSRRLQDEATRAWNFHTALYYKGGGILWRLIRDPSDFSSCFVGISFYRTLEGDRLLTSVAQVFNERGEGIIVKGGEAKIDKDDRQPHLSAENANAILKKAIQTYRNEHRTFPARVVVHKTSKITDCEADGFRSAAEEERVDTIDLISMRRSFSRLLRQGTYPPLRGTLLEMDERIGLLYLRGSVNFYESYPGLYVPRPLEFSVEEADLTLRKLAEEIFALSKLNWNNTQFDGGEPITVRAARRVGDILKCVAEGAAVQPSFRFFM